VTERASVPVVSLGEPSVPDVKRVADCAIELCPLDLVESPDRIAVEAAWGTVSTLSHEITLVSGKPCSGPTSTSDLMPLVVLVIGPQVTMRRTLMAASRVSTHTGRRLAGAPRSAQ
jgi:hypothetical protein